MKNKILHNFGNEILMGASARLVFNTQMSEGAGREARVEKADTGASGLRAAMQEQAQAQVVAATGERLDYDKLKNDPDSLGDSIQRLSNAFKKMGKSWDQLAAVFTPAGVKPSEIEYAQNQPGEAAKAEQPTDEEVTKAEQELAKRGNNEKIKGGDLARARAAKKKLDAHPDWDRWIEAASAKHNIPKSTLVIFIQMESGFNPNIINKSSGAAGFSQVIKSTLGAYRRRTGNPNANPLDPATGIDIAAWVCRDIMNSVNTMVRNGGAKGFKPEYAIGMGDIRKLYMAYNNGPLGYLVLQRYVDNPTPENFKGLTWWQKRTKDGWKERYDYSARVEAAALAYASLDAEAAKKKDAPAA